MFGQRANQYLILLQSQYREEKNMAQLYHVEKEEKT